MGNEVIEQEGEKELEIAPQVQLNATKFDAIIAFSERTEKIGRALDNIRNFVLGRAFPGDWVRFGEKLELSGPAAERVISSLALMGVSVSFTGWKYWKDTGTDKNGEWFTWWYQADVDIAGLHVEGVQGRAGSRDKFFGYEKGAFKDLGDVKEADIRMAARRGVIKEGIKMAMGLRSVPFEHAAKLGLDPAKIKTVEYASGGSTSAASTPAAAAGTELGIKSVSVRTINKKDGTKGEVFVVEDERGTKYETFSESIAAAAKVLMESKGKAIFAHTPNGKFAPKLNSLIAVKASADAPGDAQEDGEPQG